MINNNSNNKALHIFLGIFVIVAAGVGGYFIWDYYNIQKINSTTVTIDQAMQMAQDVLNSSCD